jgi:hypothetical protein
MKTKPILALAFIAILTSPAAANPEILSWKETAGNPPNYAAPEAIALQSQTLAKPAPLSTVEYRFILEVQKAVEGKARDNDLSLSFFQAHPSHFAAKIATLGSNPALWTPQLIAASPSDAVAWLGRHWHPEKAALAYDATKQTGASSPPWRKVFKLYRATLEPAAQITATQNEVQHLTSLPSRTPDQNAWLADLTLDLVSLRLNTPPE